jgi:hypothetical protein
LWDRFLEKLDQKLKFGDLVSCLVEKSVVFLGGYWRIDMKVRVFWV